MLLPIVIVIGPGHDLGADVAVIRDACTKASPPEAPCEVRDRAPAPETATALVDLAFSDATRTEALITVRLRLRPARERRLTFDPADPQRERLRAIGFAIGTLVEEAQSAPPPPPPASAPDPIASTAPPASASAAPPPSASSAPPAASSAPPPPPPPERSLVVHISAQLMSGGPTASGGVEVGAGLARGRLEGLLRVGGVALGRGDQSELKADALWVGLEARVQLRHASFLSTWVRAALGAEWQRYTASRRGIEESAGAALPWGEVGVWLDAQVLGPVSLGPHATVGARAGRAEVVVAGEPQAALGPLRLTLGLTGGARF